MASSGSQIERKTEAAQSSSAAEAYGNYRRISVPWNLIGTVDKSGPPRRWETTASAYVTHNQRTSSVNVGESFQIANRHRSKTPARPLSMDALWQVREAGSTPADDWRPARSHGRVVVRMPVHRAVFDGIPAADLPEPAALDGIPLWGTDSVGEPGRLLSELLADRNFAELTTLGSRSAQDLRDVLSEPYLRATPQLQSNGGVFTELLHDEQGDVVGWVRLTARIEPGRPLVRSGDGEFLLETKFVQRASVSQSEELTSGITMDGSGGGSFTTDHEQGHPHYTSSLGGNVGIRIEGGLHTHKERKHAGYAELGSGVRTTSSHLVTPAKVTYEVTLHRADGGRSGAASVRGTTR